MTQQPEQDAIFRAKHIGASEVSALFDANPYCTHYELWHRKQGNIAEPDFTGNERIDWGVRLEPVIIEAACDRFGYSAVDTPERLTNDAGLGGHPDQHVKCPTRGLGTLEVKTADWLVAKQWGDEPPLHYQMQAMTYMGLSGHKWGELIALVGGNELRRYEIDFRPKLFEEIKKRVAEFWESIEQCRQPKPDYTQDGKIIAELNTPSNGELVNLSHDNLATVAAADWLAADADEKDAKKRKDAAKAELMDKIGEADTGMLDDFIIDAPTVKATPERTISADDVGTIIKGRKAYRRFAVKERK